MRSFKFRRIAFDDWERVARGVIEESEYCLEIKTENKAIKQYLKHHIDQQVTISNPVSWTENDYLVHLGDYKAIYMNDEGIMLRKLKVRKEC